MTSQTRAGAPACLHDYGYTPAVAQHFPPDQPTRPARAVRVDRNRVLVATEHGLEGIALPGSLPDGPIVTGDWLRLEPTADGPRAVGILPRTSLLRRKDAHDGTYSEQLLAANADVVAAVVPVDRPLSENRLERTLVAIWDSGAVPLVVVTKADIVGMADDVVARLALDSGGAAVVTTAASTGDGLDELAAHVPDGTTMALLGPSGAGKSTLVNALVGREVQSTGLVRVADGRGRHTTTARELVPIPGGGVLLDTPGVRGFGLWNADAGLAETFADIEQLARRCRFSDCAHGSEPGCAVRGALETGSLERRRWDSFTKMQRELARLHRSQDVLARKEYSRAMQRRMNDRSERDAYRRRAEGSRW